MPTSADLKAADDYRDLLIRQDLWHTYAGIAFRKVLAEALASDDWQPVRDYIHEMTK